MNIKKLMLVIMLMAFVVTVSTGTAFAQASLASGDAMNDIEFEGNKYSVIRDSKNPNQWYYLPGIIRLAEIARKDKDGNVMKKGSKVQKQPIFTLLKFQQVEGQKVIEGGRVQFTATMELPDGAHEAIIKQIAKDKKLDKSKIRLGGMPLKSSTISIYDSNNKLVETLETQPGLGPTTSTAHMPFSFNLSKLDSKIVEQLVRSTTGYKMVINYTYLGLTPKVGFKVEVDWSQSYSHFSEQSKKKSKTAGRRWYGWWWRPWWYWHGQHTQQEKNTEVTRVREEMEEAKCLKVDITASENFTKADADKYLEPLLTRINSELMEKNKPMEKIEPAKVKDPNNPAQPRHYWWNSATNTNENYAMKDIKKVKKGKETINFNIQFVQERHHMAGGFLGIGNYPEEVQDEHILTLKPGDFERGFFNLPTVNEGVLSKITQVDLTVGILVPDLKKVKKGKEPKVKDCKAGIWKGKEWTLKDNKLATWKPSSAKLDGWRDVDGVSRTALAFALQSYYQGKEYRDHMDKFYYLINYRITVNGKDVTEKAQIMPILDGDYPVVTPFALFSNVVVDPRNLTFKAIDDESTLKSAKIKITNGKTKILNETIKPKNEDDEVTEVYSILAVKDEPLTAVVSYKFTHPFDEESKKSITVYWPGDEFDEDFELDLEEVTDPKEVKNILKPVNKKNKEGVDLHEYGTKIILDDMEDTEGNSMWIKE